MAGSEKIQSKRYTRNLHTEIKCIIKETNKTSQRNLKMQRK